MTDVNKDIDVCDARGQNLSSEKEASICDEDKSPKPSCTKQMFSTLLTLNRGWRIYQNYEVMFAGLALASLYLTVLGFHHITVGQYCIST